MFYEASIFNQPIEKWDVSKVTNMSKMFCCVEEFNQPLEEWKVDNVTDMSYMFYGTVFDQPLQK
jgi:surface protein